jgi:hypothetical protein
MVMLQSLSDRAPLGLGGVRGQVSNHDTKDYEPV